MFHKARMGTKLSSLWINSMMKWDIFIEDSFYSSLYIKDVVM